MAVQTKQQLHQIILVILVAARSAACQSKPGCPTNCGNLSIPYPFGTGEGCYLDESFLINCTHDSTTAIPFLGPDKITVLNISLDNGELQVPSPVFGDCYNISTIEESSLNLTHFPISSTRNKFTALGCDTVGEFVGYTQNKSHTTSTKIGCVALCSTPDDITAASNGTCSGTGCCQISIPSGLSSFKMETWSKNNHSTTHDSNPCGYAFIAEDGAFNFSSTNLNKINPDNISVPMVVDWAVGNQTCQQAQEDGTSYACQAQNSECYNSTTGLGYLCKCQTGFQGNPYLPDGCKESNMEPNHPKEHEGDGSKDKSRGNLILLIGLTVSLSLLAVTVGCINVYPQVRERKLNKMRENYFQQNGGIMLQQQSAAHHGSTERATIFTAQELKKATNNYDEVRILGKGAHGTVYKGVLSDSRVVAIKKSKISNQSEIEQFINEVVVLSQINHRNVVKLLGCCLETEVPMLVYEFITNGSLSDHLHVEGEAPKLPWTTRLRIAAETAEALAYLHSAASTPIIHRDVKTANILLDDNLTAKVSDFGASKLVPLDQSQLTTLVQGTLGYLDPEYFQTGQLTEKSDVYSFGVVLAELLTSKKALSFLRPESERNLSMYFVSSMSKGRLPQILETRIVNDANVEHMTEVANLAKRCLRLQGEERPTMKEVAMELEGIRILEKHSLGATSNVSEEETEYFLKVRSPTKVFGIGDGSSGSSIITRFDSLQDESLESLRHGR